MTSAPRLELPPRLERSLSRGHPWVYRDQLERAPRLKSGSWVEIRCGKVEAYALWDGDSPLALRIFSRERRPDKQWWQQRVQEAWQLRADTLDLKQTNAFRWIHGEQDSLPGIVVDHYAGYAVVVLDSPALGPLLPDLVAALQSTQELRGILLRQRGESPQDRLKLSQGRLPPRPLVVLEHGLRFRVDLEAGQKTGLFLDHRENRSYLERYALGRSVLNLFSYSGAFSLYAARGRARRIVSVDVAPGAAADAVENFRINGFSPDPHEFVVADVFEYLERARQSGERYDLVICDPPSFARNQSQLKKALHAYTRVNAAGLKVVQPGGLYAAASCTSRVSPAVFSETLAESARRARRRLQVLADRGQATDHPVMAAHPEGRYLKFVVGRVLEWA